MLWEDEDIELYRSVEVAKQALFSSKSEAEARSSQENPHFLADRALSAELTSLTPNMQILVPLKTGNIVALIVKGLPCCQRSKGHDHGDRRD
jgi:hypothetical protein